MSKPSFSSIFSSLTEKNEKNLKSKAFQVKICLENHGWLSFVSRRMSSACSSSLRRFMSVEMRR